MDWLFQYADPSVDWNYAMITLVIRFIGVFLVMIVMQVALQASARAVGYIDGRGRRAEPPGSSPPANAGPGSPESGLNDASVAAIGLALALEARPHRSPQPAARGPSAWALAGRIQRLTQRLR